MNVQNEICLQASVCRGDGFGADSDFRGFIPGIRLQRGMLPRERCAGAAGSAAADKLIRLTATIYRGGKKWQEEADSRAACPEI